MSTRLALTLVGTAVGAYFGYPQLGAVAGGLIGSYVDPTTIQGPRINETRTQSAAEGVPRSVIFGTFPCAGNIIQAGPLRIVQTSTSQGKGSTKVKGEKGLRTFAIGICEGVGYVLAVKQDGKLVYDVRAGSQMLSESAKWIANKVFYTGAEDQLPDPNLELLDADTPAYRGTMYMVAVDEDVTRMSGAISQYEFVVARAVEPPDVLDVSSSATIPVYTPGGSVQYQFVNLNSLSGSENASVASMTSSSWMTDGSTDYLIHEVDSACSIVGTANLPISPGGNWAAASPVPTSTIFPLGHYGATVVCRGTAYPSGRQLYVTSGGNLNAVLVPDGSALDYWYADNTGQDANIGRYLWINAFGIYLGVTTRDGNPVNKIYFWPTGSAGSPTSFRVNASAILSSICATPGQHFLMHLGRDGKLRVINDIGEYSVYSPTLGLESTETLPFSIASVTGFGVDEDTAVFTLTSPGRIIVRSVSDWSLSHTYTNSTVGSKGNGVRLVFTEESLFIQCQDSILRAEYQTSLSGLPAVLGDIVDWLHRRCGINASKYDTSELVDTVLGFGMGSAGYTAADAIDSLRLGYYFDKSAREKLYYPKRGKSAVKTITINDLTTVPDSTRRAQTAEIPYKLNVRYRDPIAGYAVLTQTAGSDSPDRRTTGEVTLDLPIALTADDAAQISDKSYKVTLAEVEGKVELTLMLDVATDLAEADCVGYVTPDGRTMRLRIEQEEFADWCVKITAVADRQSAYTSEVTGLPTPEPTLPPSTIVGPTELAIIDGPARTDSEDEISYLAAATGALPPWYGAELQRSMDGGANYQEVYDFDTAARMGVLLEDLPAASPYYTDTTNIVKIQFYRSTAVIDSLTETQFLTAGQGVFALENADGTWEYMQGRDVDIQVDDSVHLSTLHRGIGNSGGTAHTVGARFVWLADATYIPASSSWIGASLTHRAVSFDETEDETTNEETATYVGRSQTEWPIADLALSRDVSDIITWSFSARHRFGSDDAPVASSNFQGFRVTLDDGADSITFDTTAQSGTTDASALSAPVTFSVSALNRITGSGPATSESI